VDPAKRLLADVLGEWLGASRQVRAEVQTPKNVIVLRGQRLLPALPGRYGLTLDTHVLSQVLLAELEAFAQELGFLGRQDTGLHQDLLSQCEERGADHRSLEGVFPALVAPQDGGIAQLDRQPRSG
jgi:hypothetical protein